MALFLILVGSLTRIATHFHDVFPFSTIFQYLPHIPNFAPIAALALLGGAYLNKKYALIVPLIAMVVADYFIGFYNPFVMSSVYGSFILVGFIGLWLKKNKSLTNILGASLTSSIVFFGVTNFAVWMAPQFYYQRTLQGLLDCYVLALPFFRNTIAGDLFYVGVFFGLMELSILAANKLKKRNPAQYSALL